MPARDDGMKVVKSRRGHGAVSPETARANARKRREAQRRHAERVRSPPSLLAGLLAGPRLPAPLAPGTRAHVFADAHEVGRCTALRLRDAHDRVAWAGVR